MVRTCRAPHRHGRVHRVVDLGPRPAPRPRAHRGGFRPYHRVSLCLGTGHAHVDYGRNRARRRAWRSYQECRSTRTDGKGRHVGRRQNGYPHRRETLRHGIVPAEGYDEATLLRMAGSVERASEHPLALAVVSAAKSRGITLPEATGFDSPPARAPSARWRRNISCSAMPASLRKRGSTLL
jgi:hypothetical protein